MAPRLGFLSYSPQDSPSIASFWRRGVLCSFLGAVGGLGNSVLWFDLMAVQLLNSASGVCSTRFSLVAVAKLLLNSSSAYIMTAC
jgi:hypothetical protein